MYLRIATVIALIIGLVLPNSLLGQVDNNWVFGKNAGLNFAQSPPKQFTSAIRNIRQPPHQLDTIPANTASSISDCSGNLLFYTNGCKVWDSTHKLMKNGDSLCWNPNSNNSKDLKAQSSQIVKKPGTSKKYYIFNRFNDVFSYALVDINKSRGEVIKKQKILNTNNKSALGSLLPTIVRHQNNKDFWFVCPTYNRSTFGIEFYCFPVTASGIGKPVITKVSSQFNLFGGLGGGKIHATQNGEYLLIPGNFQKYPGLNNHSVGFRYLFNNKTGKVKVGKHRDALLKVKQINPNWPSSGNSSPGIFGIEPSPNNKLIYLIVDYVDNSFSKKVKIFQVRNQANKPHQSAIEIG